MGLIIIMILFFLLELSGYLITKKFNLQTKYSIVFGFLLIIAFFEVVSFPLIVLQITFTLYCYFVWPLLIGFYLILFKLLKFNKKVIKEWLNTFTKTKLLVYFVGLLVGLYVGMIATSINDSILYLPMVLHPLQTNSLTYSFGNVHVFDGYYKFLSFITYYASTGINSSYIFLTTFYKALEVVVIINSFAFIAEQVFSKREKTVFLIMVIGLICECYYLLPNSVSTDFLSELYYSSPNGLALLEVIIIPFLFIYLYKGYKSNKFLLLLLLAGLGMTSSMTYVYLIFLPNYLWYEVFINKKYQVRDFLGKIMMLLL
ncbi:MAG: DUF6077 domain-containing protein, partial [Mycoplasmatales bacterium]